uniref:Uncharacterized protein n=1 Tax=Aegilops tauschii subsp. strangulata TaxID=200361 RepID=A0A453A3A6_AEGTS
MACNSFHVFIIILIYVRLRYTILMKSMVFLMKSFMLKVLLLFACYKVSWGQSVSRSRIYYYCC